ncbi:MAG: response regulator [Anaerolineae bacterium]|nr:response regulator [Anaerolineae bacterium]
MKDQVLVIEDNIINCEMLKHHLEATEIQVETARTGEAGLALASRLLPQAVIISTSLPDMSGTDVAQQLRSMKRTQHIFLMMLSDGNSHWERLTGLELGVDDFISAPFDPEEVMLRVRNAIRRAQASNMVDPNTGLPAGRLVSIQLRQLLQRPNDTWALMHVAISGLGGYRDVHGFDAASDFLRSVTVVLAEVLSHDAVLDDFLGYNGNDDFIIITHSERLESLREEVSRKFALVLGAHYSLAERERGYMEIAGVKVPLAGVRMHGITAADGPFYDIRSLSEALAG